MSFYNRKLCGQKKKKKNQDHPCPMRETYLRSQRPQRYRRLATIINSDNTIREDWCRVCVALFERDGEWFFASRFAGGCRWTREWAWPGAFAVVEERRGTKAATEEKR